MNTSSTAWRVTLALLGIVFVASVHSARAGNDNQALPGGANPLQEAHGDWRVACSEQNGHNACALSQQLLDRDSRQRILAIELNAPASGQVDGTIVLPFGLSLEKGVTLHVDESAAGPALRFRTCLPAGCIVVVSFDATAIAALKTATTITVKATGDNAQALAFPISLRGFASAIDRTAALAGHVLPKQ